MDNVNWIPAFTYLGAIGLIILGVSAMVFYTNLIRIILGLLLLEGGINLFFITVGYRPNSAAPIFVDSSISQLNTISMVDPVPQALVLTAIVIGVGVQALALALVIKVYKAFGTLEMPQLTAKIAALPTDTSQTSKASVATSQHEADMSVQKSSTEQEQNV